MRLGDAKDGAIGVYGEGKKKPSLMLPEDMIASLRDVAASDDIAYDADEWLVGEISYAGEPLKGKCKNCGGTGGFLAPVGERMNGRRAFRHDGSESRFARRLAHFPCPVCAVVTEPANSKEHKQLEQAWIVDPELVIQRSEDIWWDYPGREDMGAAVQRAIARFASGDTSGMLTLIGPYGCGKSSLAEEIVRACVAAHIPALYVSTERFKKAVTDSIGRADGDSMSPDLDRIQSTPVVVFDQIDWIREKNASGGTTFAAERARDVFHQRYASRRYRATVYVVNTDAWEQSGVDALAAIYDRMREGEIVFSTLAGLREQISGQQQ